MRVLGSEAVGVVDIKNLLTSPVSLYILYCIRKPRFRS